MGCARQAGEFAAASIVGAFSRAITGLRHSRAVVSPSTLRHRSGSTPHDLTAVDRRSNSHQPLSRRSTSNARARARPPIFPPSHRKRRAETHRQHANRRTHRQNDRTNHFNPNSLSQPRRPNPHSARGTAVTYSTAISCLGAFRSPAASARAYSPHAGDRKPAQKQKSHRDR